MERAQLEARSSPGPERAPPIPILDFVRAIGLPAIARQYEKKRKARAHSLLEGKSVRGSGDALHDHVPEDIREARERDEATLTRAQNVDPGCDREGAGAGRPRENAEYEAAKLRQANAGAAAGAINTLERTRLLESIEIDDSGSVSEPKRCSPRSRRMARRSPTGSWAGDGGLYPGVLSYRAPLARPLLGKPVGSEVVLEFPDGPRRYRIESIARRVPA
jgi:transcription elongation GreA/GreB family factor